MWLIPWCMWCKVPPPQQNDRHLWKHYLPTTNAAGGNKGPRRNPLISWPALPFIIPKHLVRQDSGHIVLDNTYFSYDTPNLNLLLPSPKENNNVNFHFIFELDAPPPTHTMTIEIYCARVFWTQAWGASLNLWLSQVIVFIVNVPTPFG